jgi:adenylate cyclase
LRQAAMKRKLLEGILIGAAAALAALIVWNTGVLDRLEYATWSWREQFFAKPGPVTGRIKLILLDQQSLDWGNKLNGLSWPWPREVYAPIIDFCIRHGARAVIFDVLYSEPSVYGVADDRALGEAIGRAPFFIGSLCLHRGAHFSTSWPRQISNRLSFDIENFHQSGAGLSLDKITRPSAVFPVEEVASVATGLANVLEDPDVDGVFRRANLFRIFDGKFVPSMGFAAFGLEYENNSNGASAHAPAQTLSARFEQGCLKLCGQTIPVDREGRLILRFRGPAGVFKSYSAAAVIESEMLARAGRAESIENDGSFKDAFVFLGFSAPGLVDLRPTPLSNICPGVEIHATLLDNLLTGDFLRDATPLTVVLSTLLLAVLAAVCVVSLATKAWHSVLAFALFAPMPAVVGFVAYPFGLWWPVVVQANAVAAALTGAIVLNYATEGRRKAFIKKAFRHYLSPAVIERILNDPSQLKLGGERKELTILFSDIEGFSTFSEKLDPENLTSLLNIFLSDMTDIILDEGGTLDKYEGDAIIAFWNAPLDQPDHAERACRAALRCQQKILERQEEYSRKAGAPLRMRIGINTGEVVVGNMGSAKRFDYTVLGDAANLASRLEGANKFFGTRIMISEETWQKTSGKFTGRQLGLIRVVGRANPVQVFELAGMEAGPEACGETFDRAIACCLEKKWREAIDLFDSRPDDPVARRYAGHCRNIIENPGRDWDGIWNLDRK